MRQKDDKKEQQIFDATLELVVKTGLAGVTMCDISKAAGIATGTLYIYFKNKEDLINELFTLCRKQSAAFYFNNLKDEEPFEESFQKVFYNIVQYRLHNFKKSVLLEQYYHSPYVSEKNRQLSASQLQPFYKLMERGKKEKLVKDCDSLLILWFVVGCINEVMKGCYYKKRQVADSEIADLYTMCWDGIRNPRP